MFLLFGFRTKIESIGVRRLACRYCGNVAAQSLAKRVTKFTLFFVPLFSVRTRYQIQCAHCAATYDVSRSEARDLVAH